MQARKLNAVLGASLLLALLASCQAPQAAAPDAVVTTAQAAPAAADPLATVRQAMGYPAWLARPPRGPLGLAPRFDVKADNLWGLELTLSTATKDQEYVDLAWNANTKGYLSAWHDFRNDTDGTNADVYASLHTTTGTTSGAAFAISSAAGMQMGPRVLYNSVNQEYLVAWTDTRNGNSDVYTRRVTGAGAVTGSELAAASGAGNQTLASIAYHPTTGQYLVTWTDDATGSAVLKGGRITASTNAKVAGSDVTISTLTGDLAGGGIAIYPTTNDYNVVWANAGTTPGIYFRRVTSAGAVAGSVTALATGAGYEFYTPRIVYNSVYPGFLVAFDRRTTASGEADVILQRLTSAGVATGAASAVTAVAGAQMFPNVSVNSSDGNYFICWSDGRAGSEQLDVYGKMVDKDGVEFLAEYTASATAGLQALPAVAFDAVKQHFLVGWQDSRNHGTQGWDLYVQRVVSAPMTAEDIMYETLEVLNDMEPGNAGGVNGARSQLENAIAKILADKDTNAVNHLENFISQISGIDDAILSPEEKAILIALANEAIEQIEAGNW